MNPYREPEGRRLALLEDLLWAARAFIRAHESDPGWPMRPYLSLVAAVEDAMKPQCVNCDIDLRLTHDGLCTVCGQPPGQKAKEPYTAGMYSAMAHQARDMAIKAHGDQLYGDQPYMVHVDAVACLVEDMDSEEALAVAYLHDTVEDTLLTVVDIEAAFGPLVARCVDLLTDPKGTNRKARKAVSYARLAAVDCMSPERLALVVKAADRLANVRTCTYVGKPHRRLFTAPNDE